MCSVRVRFPAELTPASSPHRWVNLEPPNTGWVLRDNLRAAPPSIPDSHCAARAHPCSSREDSDSFEVGSARVWQPEASLSLARLESTFGCKVPTASNGPPRFGDSTKNSVVSEATQFVSIDE